MLSKKIEKTINDQVNYEFYSSYLYLSMASYFGSMDLQGFVNWLKVQALEELYHAMKMYSFIEERGGRPVLAAVEKPAGEWPAPLKVFETILAHEQGVSDRINNIVNIALEEKDHATNNFFQWFVGEQVEEESSAKAVVQKLKLVDDKSGLFMLDREMATRVMNIPPDIKVTLTLAGGGGTAA